MDCVGSEMEHMGLVMNCMGSGIKCTGPLGLNNMGSQCSPALRAWARPWSASSLAWSAWVLAWALASSAWVHKSTVWARPLSAWTLVWSEWALPLSTWCLQAWGPAANGLCDESHGHCPGAHGHQHSPVHGPGVHGPCSGHWH